jgi:hypothetical protein
VQRVAGSSCVSGGERHGQSTLSASCARFRRAEELNPEE